MVKEDEIRNKKGQFIKGHSVPYEWKEKCRKALKGRHLSGETKKRISLSLIGEKRNFRYKQTEEHKRKISEAVKKQWASGIRRGVGDCQKILKEN